MDIPTNLVVASASDWKRAMIQVVGESELIKMMWITFEPAPTMTIHINKKLYDIVDVNEHINGDFDVYVSPSDWVKRACGLS